MKYIKKFENNNDIKIDTKYFKDPPCKKYVAYKTIFSDGKEYVHVIKVLDVGFLIHYNSVWTYDFIDDKFIKPSFPESISAYNANEIINRMVYTSDDLNELLKKLPTVVSANKYNL